MVLRQTDGGEGNWWEGDLLSQAQRARHSTCDMDSTDEVNDTRGNSMRIMPSHETMLKLPRHPCGATIYSDRSFHSWR